MEVEVVLAEKVLAAAVEVDLAEALAAEAEVVSAVD